MLFFNWIISKTSPNTFISHEKDISTNKKPSPKKHLFFIKAKLRASHIPPMDTPRHALKRFEPRWFGRNQYQRTEQGIQYQYRAGNPEIFGVEEKKTPWMCLHQKHTRSSNIDFFQPGGCSEFLEHKIYRCCVDWNNGKKELWNGFFVCGVQWS